MIRGCLLHGGVRSHVVDAALVLALDHADVALLSPGGSPAVLNNPVFLGARDRVADSQDTMVELSSASSREDTARVELEGALVSLNGDRDGGQGNSGDQSRLRALLNILEGFVLANGLASLLAGLVSGNIGVVALRADTIGGDPSEGVVHQTAIASLVARAASAVNQHLFREGRQLLVLDEHGTLERAGSGESPARSALTLILDGGDGAL